MTELVIIAVIAAALTYLGVRKPRTIAKVVPPEPRRLPGVKRIPEYDPIPDIMNHAERKIAEIESKYTWFADPWLHRAIVGLSVKEFMDSLWVGVTQLAPKPADTAWIYDKYCQLRFACKNIEGAIPIDDKGVRNIKEVKRLIQEILLEIAKRGREAEEIKEPRPIDSPHVYPGSANAILNSVNHDIAIYARTEIAAIGEHFLNDECKAQGLPGVHNRLIELEARASCLVASKLSNPRIISWLKSLKCELDLLYEIGQITDEIEDEINKAYHAILKRRIEMEEKKEQELSAAKVKAISEALQLFADCSADKIPPADMMRKLADVIEQAEEIDQVVEITKRAVEEELAKGKSEKGAVAEIASAIAEADEMEQELFLLRKRIADLSKGVDAKDVDDNPSDSELERQCCDRGGEKIDAPDFDVYPKMPETLEELEARRKEIEDEARAKQEPVRDAALEIIRRQVDSVGAAIEASLPLERIITDKCKHCGGGTNSYGYPSCGAPGQANVMVTVLFVGGYYGGQHGLCFRFKK